MSGISPRDAEILRAFDKNVNKIEEADYGLMLPVPEALEIFLEQVRQGGSWNDEQKIEFQRRGECYGNPVSTAVEALEWVDVYTKESDKTGLLRRIAADPENMKHVMEKFCNWDNKKCGTVSEALYAAPEAVTNAVEGMPNLPERMRARAERPAYAGGAGANVQPPLASGRLSLAVVTGCAVM
jgi:hypothetical protein